MSNLGCEECYRNLVRRYRPDGDDTLLIAVFEELVAITEADEGPYAASLLDPETVEL